MRIDLYNNHQAFIQEQRQDRAINKWLRRKGITAQDLEQHPQIRDVIDLVDIRDRLWERMNYNEQAVWAAYWNIVYHKRRPLRDKAWNKFGTIVKAIDTREEYMAHHRQRIMALRLNNKQNPINMDDHNDG